MATLFWPPRQNGHTFSCKETLVNRVTSLLWPIFFGPLVTILTGFQCITCQLSSVIQNSPWYGTNLQVFCRSANLPDEIEFWVLCALVWKLVDYSQNFETFLIIVWFPWLFWAYFHLWQDHVVKKANFESELHIRLCIMSWAIPMCYNLGLGRFVLVEGVGG